MVRASRQLPSRFTTTSGGTMQNSPSSCVRNQALSTQQKWWCLPRIVWPAELPQPIAAVGVPGLPADHQLPQVPGTVQKQISVGDADPPDLMVYAWLREQLAIEWYGVNDAFLNSHGCRESDRMVIALGSSERAVIARLPDFCPDYSVLLGPYCASLLDGGFKIEVESAIADQPPREDKVWRQ